MLAPYVNTITMDPQAEKNATTGPGYMYTNFASIPMMKCPAVISPDPTLPFVLDYTINSIDFNYWQSTGTYRSVKFQQFSAVPVGLSQVVYIAEINPTCSVMQPANNYAGWNIDDTPEGPYNILSQVNPDPRSISANDMRHGGVTPLVFFDSHVGLTKLTPQTCPFSLFNPLQPIKYP